LRPLEAARTALAGVGALGGSYQDKADEQAKARHEWDYQQALKAHKRAVAHGMATAADAPEKGAAPAGVSVAGSALQGVAAVGGAVVGAFQAIVGAGQTLFNTFLTMGSAAAPGLGKTFSEIFEYLTAVIGQHFVPFLIPLGAYLLSLGDTISSVTQDIVATISEFVERAKELMSYLPTAKTSDFEDQQQKAFKKDFLAKPEDEKVAARLEAGLDHGEKFPWEDDKAAAGGPGGKGAKGPAMPDMNDFMAKMLRSVVQNSGQGNPAFEGSDAAWKRIQLSEAGTSDIKRDTLEVQRKMLDTLLKMLEKQTGAAADDGAIRDGGGAW
jgi:hypothetical protein